MDFGLRIQTNTSKIIKLVDSLELDSENRARMHLHLFQFSLRDQASNWLERLLAGSITTWEDLTTRFLVQFFPLGRDFAKPVKASALAQDVPTTSDRHLIELENQVECLMVGYLSLAQPTQVNKVTTSCEICSGPHNTQYYMEDSEHAFVEYVSLRIDEARGALPRDTVKNLKLSTSPVLSTRSYPTMDPQCSTLVHGSITAVTVHSEKQGNSYDEKAK
nr:MAK10-like protein [Tanacetum cinerariifolium]